MSLWVVAVEQGLATDYSQPTGGYGIRNHKRYCTFLISGPESDYRKSDRDVMPSLMDPGGRVAANHEAPANGRIVFHNIIVQICCGIIPLECFMMGL